MPVQPNDRPDFAEHSNPFGHGYGQPPMSSRRVASARPPADGAARSFGHGLQAGLRARELCRAILDGFKQHDLLTYSSAISFQIITAVVPFLMFVLALARLLHLNNVWVNHVAPEIRSHVSAAVLSVISSAVNKAFSSRALLWATVGGWPCPVAGVRGRASGDGSVRSDLRRNPGRCSRSSHAGRWDSGSSRSRSACWSTWHRRHLSPCPGSVSAR